MGSPWTDKSAILRDLSFAQGRWVPGGIDAAVAGGKPPTQNITEETEEEYFQHWTTEGDFSSGPDLSLIKKMLEMVHDEEPEPEDVLMGSIEITKTLNPVAKLFVPKSKKNEAKQCDKKNVLEIKPLEKSDKKTELKKKPLRSRNVAIASLIAISEKIAMDVKDVPLKLSKPEDFMKVKKTPVKDDEELNTFNKRKVQETPVKNDEEVNTFNKRKVQETPVKNDEEVNAFNKRKDSVNKVNNWLLSQDMTSMFRKKSFLKSVHENSDEQSSLKKKSPLPTPDGSVKSPQSSGKSPKRDGNYVPSSWAGEYYKKCVERSHIQDMIKENVWEKAEKIMKQIDDKKAEDLRQQKEAEEALAAEIAAAEVAAAEVAAAAEAVEAAEVTEAAETAEPALIGDTVDDKDEKPAIYNEPDNFEAEGIAKVILPQHRHLLTGDCVVCKVLSKKKPLEKEELFETEPKPMNEVSQTKSEDLDGIIQDPQEIDLFCLVRSTFVENLSEMTEAPAFNCLYTSESTSLEELDIFA